MPSRAAMAEGMRAVELIQEISVQLAGLHEVFEVSKKNGLCESDDEPLTGRVCGLSKDHPGTHADALDVLKLEHEKFREMFGSLSRVLAHSGEALKALIELNKELQRGPSDNIVLQFIASLTLADHMGDVGNNISEVLDQMGLVFEGPEGEESWETLEDLSTLLAKRGVTTLQGTSLVVD